jgi:ribosomal protein L37E
VGSNDDGEEAAGDVAAFSMRPICVQCRACGRKSAFRSTSSEARALQGDAVKRLACSACGARDPKVFRLSDDREATRWLADR